MLKTALNYDWRFQEGFDTQSLTTPIKGEEVDLPHTVKPLPKNYFDQDVTQMVSTYQKSFPYALKEGRRLFLICEGIMSKATVYLNGSQLTHHVGGYTAFTVELTEHLKQENLLTIEVDSRETPDHPPFGKVVDYLTYGGIYREVSLLETGPSTFEHVLVDGDATTLNIRARLDSEHSTEACTFEVHDRTKKRHTFTQSSEGGAVELKEPHDLSLWSLDTPTLYTIKGYINGELEYEGRFGVRTLNVTEDGFTLNGERLFLRGLNRHQSYPYVGYAMPASAQRRDVDILKYELQTTMVRSSHYPPSKHFLDRCDEVGLLVFTELPGWQHIGDDDWKTHALNDLKALVIEDYNHPSIAMIGTRINESKDDDSFYRATRDLVKGIDPTRPTGGVRFIAKSQLYEDVYTMNDFTHRGYNQGLTAKRRITSKRHPYLVTEYNGHMFPTKAFDDEAKRVEHAHRHFRVLDDAYAMKGLMGAIGWCMNDYNTHREFGSNDHVCYHGVLDMNRNAKYAASVYASQGENPYMEVLSMMHIGERAGGELREVTVATNCDYVEVYNNDAFIGSHYPSTRYENLPHPPIIIDDFIGGRIEQNEVFSKKDARRIKRIMLYMLKHGLAMRLRDKIVFGYILFKYKLTYDDAVNLYTKYVGGWGEDANRYTFKGYKDGAHVLTSHKGTDDTYRLNVTLDGETLYHKDTYDTLRFTAELVNAFSERAYYSHEVITVHTEGPIRVMGPKRRALQGGVESVWIRSLSQGEGTITLETEHYGTHTRAVVVE